MPDAEEIINTVLDEDGVFQPLNIERNYRTAKGMIPKLLKLVGRIPFADDLAAAYYTALDPKTPTKAKAILLAAVAYFVLPGECDQYALLTDGGARFLKARIDTLFIGHIHLAKHPAKLAGKLFAFVGVKIKQRHLHAFARQCTCCSGA